jgi:tetratricopeptide (TPR) repeat protein
LFDKALAFNKKDSSIPNWYAGFLSSMGRVKEAESMYMLALDRSRKNKSKWEQEGILRSLARLYHYKMKRYTDAEKMYRKAIALKQYSHFTEESLVALLADKMNRVAEAKELFDDMNFQFADKQDVMLRRTLFAAYGNDKASFSKLVKEAIEKLSEEEEKRMDITWQRSAAVAIRLGYGEQLQAVFRETEQDRISRPFYEAIKALTLNSEDYLKTEVAAEVREVALHIFKFMQDYNAPVPQTS